MRAALGATPGAPRARAARREPAAGARRRCRGPAALPRERAGRCVRLGSASVPRLREIDVGPEVLLFTLVVSLVSGLVFGLAPAWRLSRPDLQSTLTEGRRGSSAAGGLFSRRDALRRRAGGRRDRALGRAAGRRGPAGPQLRARAAGAARLQPAGRADLRADDERAALQGAARGARDLPAALAAPREPARRHGGGRRLGAALEPDDGVGPDHGGGAHAGAGRGVHQRRHPRRGRRLLRGDADPAPRRAAASTSTTRATSRA